MKKHSTGNTTKLYAEKDYLADVEITSYDPQTGEGKATFIKLADKFAELIIDFHKFSPEPFLTNPIIAGLPEKLVFVSLPLGFDRKALIGREGEFVDSDTWDNE